MKFKLYKEEFFRNRKLPSWYVRLLLGIPPSVYAVEETLAGCRQHLRVLSDALELFRDRNKDLIRDICSSDTTVSVYNKNRRLAVRFTIREYQ